MYGFARPVLRLQSSGLVNLYDLRVDLFPISFAGLSLGHSESLRSYDAQKIDCDKVECRGTLKRNYLRVASVLGSQGYFAAATARWDQLSPVRKRGNFYDEQSSLVGAQGGDQLFTWEVYAGKKLFNAHTVGLWYLNLRMLKSAQRSDLESAYYKFDRGEWNLSLGAGTYRSTLQSRAFTAFASFQYVFLPSLGYF
jgi:hypothetical protein